MPAEHVPRPKNAFIFFRSYYNAHPSEFLSSSSDNKPHPDQNSVSCAAAAIWRAYSSEEKRPFQEMAEREKERYQVEYPGYKYGSGGGGGGGVKRRRSVPSAKVVGGRRKSGSGAGRRRVSIATTSARPPSPSLVDDVMESPPSPDAMELPSVDDAMSPQSSSSSATPPPRTPSPMPQDEVPDYHSDYIIGAELADAYYTLDDELDIQFSHYSFSHVDAKEPWDTYVDPVFPSYRDDPASFYGGGGGGEYTFFHQEEREESTFIGQEREEIKVEEEEEFEEEEM